MPDDAPAPSNESHPRTSDRHRTKYPSIRHTRTISHGTSSIHKSPRPPLRPYRILHWPTWFPSCRIGVGGRCVKGVAAWLGCRPRRLWGKHAASCRGLRASPCRPRSSSAVCRGPRRRFRIASYHRTWGEPWTRTNPAPADRLSRNDRCTSCHATRRERDDGASHE